MKKFLLLVLTALMLLSCLSIVSCDSSDNSTNNSNSQTPTNNSNSQNSANNPHSHSYSDWQITKEATCQSTGEQSRSCSCGDIQTASIPVTSHSWEPATYTDPKTCSVCGTTEGEPLEPIKIELTKENFEEYFTIEFSMDNVEVEKEWVPYWNIFTYSGSAQGTIKIYPVKKISLEHVEIRLNFEASTWSNTYHDITLPYDGKYEDTISFSEFSTEYISTSRYWKFSIESVSGHIVEE